jgi:hypothetical protein
LKNIRDLAKTGDLDGLKKYIENLVNNA